MSKYSFDASSKAAEIVCRSSRSTLSLKLFNLASFETGADNTPGLPKLQVLPSAFHLPGIPSLRSVKCYQLLSAYKCSLHSPPKVHKPGLCLLRSHSMLWYFHSKVDISCEHKDASFRKIAAKTIVKLRERIETLGPCQHWATLKERPFYKAAAIHPSSLAVHTGTTEESHSSFRKEIFPNGMIRSSGILEEDFHRQYHMRRILIRLEAKTFQAGGRHEEEHTGGKCLAVHCECVTEGKVRKLRLGKFNLAETTSPVSGKARAQL
ncbi:uncharacterized protein [Vicugna pacos]|uniref:Uncharacterized protein n=1 Tax=Vicugna pacos TaxID=30538 RepID=A0ABM5D781_VICPA